MGFYLLGTSGYFLFRTKRGVVNMSMVHIGVMFLHHIDAQFVSFGLKGEVIAI